MKPAVLLPRYPVPALNVALHGGGRYVLGADPGERFDLIVFYRGLHCPLCAIYLKELDRLLPEFEKRGVRVLAVSSDDGERAATMADLGNACGIEVGAAAAAILRQPIC